MTQPVPRILLLGGAPMSGKSTLAAHVTRELGYHLINTDDLNVAARAVAADPDLHATFGEDYREYYLRRSASQLMKDALRAHRALWPAVAAVIAAHATWAPPAVIEGWALLPELVETLDREAVRAASLIVRPKAFEWRTREATDFLPGASDEEGMIVASSERSRAMNEYLMRESARHDLPTLEAADG